MTVLKRIFLLCSSFILAWALYSFYLIISLLVSLISIISGQTYANFDYHATNLQLKSERILNQVGQFDFFRRYDENTRIIFNNQSLFTNLLSVAPYTLGYKSSFNILFCTEHVFSNTKNSVALASISFKNAIPQGISGNKTLQKLTLDCKSTLLEMYEGNGKNNSISYDAFIWISSYYIDDIHNVLTRNRLEVDAKEPASFEEFILKNWKVELFKSNLIHSFLVAATSGDFKIMFFDEELDSALRAPELKLVVLPN
jgi:hypothetical protein